jgi:hypothetical protein
MSLDSWVTRTVTPGAVLFDIGRIIAESLLK